MTSTTIVGVRPRLPRTLARWQWFTEPVAAQRLAALRIAVATCLLIDIGATYVPYLADYYGPASLAAPDVFADRFAAPNWHWSILRWLPETWGPQALIGVWLGAAAALLIGWKPQLAAAIAWALSLSFYNSNYYVHNSGDRLRHTLLFFLMLTPCGAVWSVSPRRESSSGALPSRTRVAAKQDSGCGQTLIYPWALRLLFIQLTLIYFFNGVYKLLGPEWRDGTVMHYVLSDAGWSRWSLNLPSWLERASAWFVMAWELCFPLCMIAPRFRGPALAIGVIFHVVSGLQLELGLFPLYALCFYVPLVPWERWSR